MICVCGDPFDAHRHGVCMSAGCRLTPDAPMPGGGEHCVSFRTALFNTPQEAHRFWVSSLQQSERTAYIDLMEVGCYVLAIEAQLAIGARVGKIENRLLVLSAVDNVRQFIKPTTTE